MGRGHRASYGKGVQRFRFRGSAAWVEGMAGKSRAEGEGWLNQRIQILKHTPPPPPLAQRLRHAQGSTRRDRVAGRERTMPVCALKGPIGQPSPGVLC